MESGGWTVKPYDRQDPFTTYPGDRAVKLSVILPFYKKADAFRRALDKNALYLQEDIELVCVLDAPDDEWAITHIVKDNPSIKFRVIVNDQEHPWRPPCKAYNVGIRHALSGHVLLTDPESVLVFEAPVGEWLDSNAHSGVTWMVPGEANPERERDTPPWAWTLGALLCPKSDLTAIAGYDESRTTYGLDDTDLRNRLLRNGTVIVVDGRIKIFHPEHAQELNRVCGYQACGVNPIIETQLETYGTSFSRVAWDWNK